MVTRNSAALAFLAGSVSGVIVLGIIGRMAMAVEAVVTGSPANLSFRGALEVVVFGGLAGAVGGLLLLAARKLFPTHQLIQSTVVALTLLVALLAIAWYGGRMYFNFHTALPITLSVTTIVLVVYAHATNVLFRRMEGQDNTSV